MTLEEKSASGEFAWGGGLFSFFGWHNAKVVFSKNDYPS